MAELVDAADLKSAEFTLVPVRVRPSVQFNRNSAGWSSQVARRAHNPEVAGSNPAPATRYVMGRNNVPAQLLFGDVAQLVRASGSYPLGPGFNSLRRYHLISAARFSGRFCCL